MDRHSAPVRPPKNTGTLPMPAGKVRLMVIVLPPLPPNLPPPAAGGVDVPSAAISLPTIVFLIVLPSLTLLVTSQTTLGALSGTRPYKLSSTILKISGRRLLVQVCSSLLH